MLTDTHAHVLSNAYDDVDSILKKLKTNNIKRIIINGYNHETNQEIVKLVKKYDYVYGALGIHPTEENHDLKQSIDYIRDNLRNPKIIAIGEIGLDFYWDKTKKSEQIEIFTEMLNLAKEFHKPVIIHSRDATKEMLEILKNYQLKGIMHCFTETYEIAQEYIEMGYKLGINGIITFKNSKLPLTLAKIPPSNILLETDCPYITPEPYRKNKNEPKYLNDIAKKVAEIYNLDRPELAEILEKNLADIFDF